MPKRIRTFIAVAIAENVRRQLVDLQKELSSAAESVNWVEPENLHLTLKFLGDVDETVLYGVCKAAERAVADQPRFEMQLAGVGAFPAARRPRVIWAGVRAGAEALKCIHQSLENHFREQGYPREDRPFTPHLTLGRARQPQPQLAASIDRLATWQGGVTSVREILVMSSLLSPAGPTYAIMGRGRLAPERTNAAVAPNPASGL